MVTTTVDANNNTAAGSAATLVTVAVIFGKLQLNNSFYLFPSVVVIFDTIIAYRHQHCC